jgi:all-trans-retinol 13,14-reductase
MAYDVVIIGAGLGGLTAGAKLSREGLKVLVMEQHDRPGGCATNFRRRDFIFEVGLHEMHGPAPGELKTKIFTDLDVFSHVEFVRIPEFYHFTNGRYSVTIPHASALAINSLTALFPKESEGIKTYFDQLLKPRKKTSDQEFKDMSLGDYLDSIIGDDDLKLILLGNLGYFHDDPYSLSLAYYTIAQGSYYSGGASFIKGGSQKLSDYLASYIREHEGEVWLNHLVTAIHTDGGKVNAVRYRNMREAGMQESEVNAGEIIANTAVPNVADLLPREMGAKIKFNIQQKKTGTSLLTIYFGFKKPLKEIGSRFYSTFVFDRSIHSLADIFSNNRGDYSKRIFTFIDYGQVDSGLCAGNKGVGALCCMDYISDWETLDKATYKAKKEHVASVFIDRLETMIPGFRDQIEYYEVATAATVKRYTLNPEGAVYGFAQNPSGKPFDPSGLPDNLHFASAWSKTGGGFSGAIYGGYLCAMNIMRKKSANR